MVITGMFMGSVNLGGSDLTSPGEYGVLLAKLDRWGNHAFSKRFVSGEAGWDAWSYAVAVDARGNIALSGQFYGPVDLGLGVFGSSAWSPIVAAFDEGGSPLWVAPVGVVTRSIAFDGSGSVLGAAEFGTDALLVKLDEGGTEAFRTPVDAGNWEELAAIAADPAGNAFAVGSTARPSSFDGTPGMPSNVLLAKTDAEGGLVWQKQLGDDSAQSASSVAIDSVGNATIAGEMSGAIDFGAGAPLAGGDQDLFIAKLDGTGAPLWARSFPRRGVSTSQLIAVDATTGDALVAGNGEVDFSATVEPAGSRTTFIARFGP